MKKSRLADTRLAVNLPWVSLNRRQPRVFARGLRSNQGLGICTTRLSCVIYILIFIIAAFGWVPREGNNCANFASLAFVTRRGIARLHSGFDLWPMLLMTRGLLLCAFARHTHPAVMNKTTASRCMCISHGVSHLCARPKPFPGTVSRPNAGLCDSNLHTMHSLSVSHVCEKSAFIVCAGVRLAAPLICNIQCKCPLQRIVNMLLHRVQHKYVYVVPLRARRLK